MSSPSIGEQLLEQGWRQGALFASGGYPVLALDVSGTWTTELCHPSKPLEQWIVVSQDCDILSPSEPSVEVMGCYWSRRGAREYTGARIGNSFRYFWIKAFDHSGEAGALVVDATIRAQLPKANLEGLDPADAEADEATFDRDFRRWLGGRYSRPPLPPEVVDAVQRPIVDGMRNLQKSDSAMAEAQQLVRELRLFPLDEAPPYEVDLIMLIRDDADPNDEGLAELRGWIETWLRESPEKVQSTRIVALRPSEMYVSEYEDTLKLPLDHYSVGGEALDASGPVTGIEHG